MPSATTPLAARRLGRRRRGRPESEDLPRAADTEPLAEGGFVFRYLLALGAALAVLVLVALPASARDGFPVTLRSAAGKVTIKKQPRRIVSLSPTATETLFAIGAGR